MKYTYEEYINLIKTMKFDNNEFSQFLLELENVCNKRDDYHLEEYIKYSVIIGKFSQYNDITPYFNRIIQLMNIFLNIAQDDFEKSHVYYSLVLVYFKSTFLPKPIEYSLKYLELNVGDDMHKMHIYNFLSIMLKQVGFYEQSFEYGMKFYEISKTIKGFDNIMLDIISYNNFCYILLDMNKYEEAMKYVDLLKEMFKNNPDNPTVKENITQTKFTFLYVKLFSNDLKINDEAISEYINIMETLINTPLHDFNKRETVETHLKFLKAMIAKGKQEEALKIALHILYDRNFFGDHISLYKLIFTILDNNKLVTDERYNELLKEFNHELLDYQTQQQDILMLLVSEQFRINQINKEYNNIKEKYEKDFLTNCYNRPSLEMNGQNFINEKINGSIVFIDLDSLKSINDKYGHLVGDFALKELARIIKNHLKKDMILYRYAGDEFIVLSMYDYSDTEDVMKKILLDMNKDMIYNHCVFTLGFSYGIVEFDKENCNMTKLIKIADAKMYECKKLRKVNR